MYRGFLPSPWAGRLAKNVRAQLNEAASVGARPPPLARRTPPFGQRVNEPDAVYVDPVIPAESRYLKRTSQGRLRHAAFIQIGGCWSHGVGNNADV